LPSVLATAGVIAAAGLALTPGPAAAASLISGFKAGVLVNENTSNPEEKDYATQAGSHPDVAFTNFELNVGLGTAEFARTDLPAGLSVNPQAIPRCSASGSTLESSCPADTQVGKAKVSVNAPFHGPYVAEGKVYNMVPASGAPGDFAFEVHVTVCVLLICITKTPRTDLVAGVRYYPSGGQPGDYGEYFTISAINSEAPLELSQLDFWGAPEEHNGGGATNNAFLTNPTLCAGPQTTYLFASTYAPLVSETASFTTPVGASGCASVPFNPTLTVTPTTKQRDKPDGIAMDVHVPQDQKPSDIATSHLKEAKVTLPEGLTLNPSGAKGLQACTEAQFGKGTNSAIACPVASEVGTAEVITPNLEKPLTGKLYVGAPEAGKGPESGGMYRLFLDAEDEAEGVKVRLVGNVAANTTTGRLVATFANDPQLPFEDLKLAFKPTESALFANSLGCQTATTTSILTPYSGNAAATPSSSFTVSNNGSGESCPGTLPFTPAASATLSNKTAGANTNLTLNLTRSDGEQTLGSMTTQLPEGLLANLGAVKLCEEPKAAEGTCSEESKIGTATVTAGAGSEPLSLSGKVYITGAYKGAQLGLSIVVPVIAGPYNLGTVVVRAAVALNTVNGQLTITTDSLPSILGGVPLRLKGVKIEINKAGFLVNPTTCAASAITGTVTSSTAQSQPFSSPVTIEGCGSLPFAPGLTVTPSTTQVDSPLGLTMELHLPVGSAELHSAVLNLPSGVTINPAVASGLEACTDAQLGVGTSNPVECPAASAVGSVNISSPLLPTPLTGSIYIGKPLSQNPESGEEYRLFVAAENATYGISARMIGALAANASSGALTATFANTPPLPFTNMTLTFNGGARAPLASPQACGSATTSANLTASTGASATPNASYTVDANGAGGACPLSGAAFSPKLSVSAHTQAAAAFDEVALEFTSGDGQQKLGSISTSLPLGLLGEVGTVPLCGEPAASTGSCPAASRVGTATVSAGVGSSPLQLSGPVYLTGPYEGAPFGLSVSVPAVAGPYNLGTVVVRAAISIDPGDAHLTITSGKLPSLLAGVPLRLKGVQLAITRSGFMINPTSCQASSVGGAVFAVGGLSQPVSSSFQATGCASLPFQPALSAAVTAPLAREEGAGLNVQISYPGEHQANLSAIAVTLPTALPARLSTLQHACPEATFAANPAGCPAASRVGEASVSTPVLADSMTGPAYLVSNGGAAFPNLDVVLSADGVTMTLRGQTEIKSGVTSARFNALPDVPIRRLGLNLPAGPGSLLAVGTGLCGAPLVMPSTLSAQNGQQISQQTRIGAAAACASGAGESEEGSGDISGLTVSPSHFHAARNGASVASAAKRRRAAGAGATVSYQAAAAGAVTFTLERQLRGERRGKSCVAPTAHRGHHRRGRACARFAAVVMRGALPGERHGGSCVARSSGAGRHGTRCTLHLRVSSFTYNGRTGANRFHFSGRLAGHRLSPGAYRLVASATGAGGRASQQTARFWILRG
jgi:hypothetical protein